MVHRLLVSGTDDQLNSFHLSLCFRLNAIQRREQTVNYTCMSEDLDDAREIALETGVTLQEIKHDDDGNESYQMLVLGEHPGWASRERAASLDEAQKGNNL